MQFKIEWCEKKNPDWIMATVTDLRGEQTENVSVNRTNKKGEVFPDFDKIMTGHTIEAELWISGTNKAYLFAPKAKTGGNRPNMDRIMDKKAGNIAEAQTRKEQSISEAQDRSAWMWAKNNASILLGTSLSLESNDTISKAVIELATKIYNGEPTEPKLK